MDKDTAYYGLATIIHSLIVKEKLSKQELQTEINRIINEMYKEFASDTE